MAAGEKLRVTTCLEGGLETDDTSYGTVQFARCGREIFLYRYATDESRREARVIVMGWKRSEEFRLPDKSTAMRVAVIEKDLRARVLAVLQLERRVSLQVFFWD